MRSSVRSYPAIEVVVHRALRGQVLRQSAPLTPAAQDIHQTVHDLADVHGPLVAAALSRRDLRLDRRPFLVGQIALVAQMAAIVTTAVLGRPHAAPLPTAPRIESH